MRGSFSSQISAPHNLQEYVNFNEPVAIPHHLGRVASAYSPRYRDTAGRCDDVAAHSLLLGVAGTKEQPCVWSDGRHFAPPWFLSSQSALVACCWRAGRRAVRRQQQEV